MKCPLNHKTDQYQSADFLSITFGLFIVKFLLFEFTVPLTLMVSMENLCGQKEVSRGLFVFSQGWTVFSFFVSFVLDGNFLITLFYPI